MIITIGITTTTTNITYFFGPELHILPLVYIDAIDCVTESVNISGRVCVRVFFLCVGVSVPAWSTHVACVCVYVCVGVVEFSCPLSLSGPLLHVLSRGTLTDLQTHAWLSSHNGHWGKTGLLYGALAALYT